MVQRKPHTDIINHLHKHVSASPVRLWHQNRRGPIRGFILGACLSRLPAQQPWRQHLGLTHHLPLSLGVAPSRSLCHARPLSPSPVFFFCFFFPSELAWDSTCSLAGYVELRGLERRSRGQICRYMVNRCFNLLKTCLCHEIKHAWGFCSACLSSFTLLAFTADLTIKMYSFQGKKEADICSLAAIADFLRLSYQISEINLPSGYAVSSVENLIFEGSLEEPARQICCYTSLSILTGCFHHSQCALILSGQPFQRGGLINHQIDMDRVEEYLTATPI